MPTAQEVQAKAAALLSEAARRSSAAAKILGDNVVELAGATARGIESSAEHVRVVGQRDVVPAVRRQLALARDALDDLRALEALQLRADGGGDMNTLDDRLAALAPRIERLTEELRRLPTPAAAVAALLVLKSVAVLNHLVDLVSDELFAGRVALSRLFIVTAVVPSCAFVYALSGALFEDPISGCKEVEDPLIAAMDGAGCEPATFRALTLATRNASRMPPAFWLASSISALFTMNVLKRLSALSLRTILQARPSALIAAIVCGATVMHAQKSGYILSLKELWAAVQPMWAKALTTLWYRFQQASREVFKQATAARAFVIEKCSRPGSPGAGDASSEPLFKGRAAGDDVVPLPYRISESTDPPAVAESGGPGVEQDGDAAGGAGHASEATRKPVVEQ